MLNGFQQGTGTAGNDNRGSVRSQLFLDNSLGLGKVCGVNNSYSVDSHSMADSLDAYSGSRVALDVEAVGRVVLMTGHACDGVIQNDNSGIACVVRNIYKTCDTRMDKGGVADHCNSLVLIFTLAGNVEAVETADGSAHADSGIHSAERSGSAKSVAADIAADHNAKLFQGVEHTSVRTSCAHYRRTDGNILGVCNKLVLFAQDLVLEIALGIFAQICKLSLADGVKSYLAAVSLDNVVQLFDNIKLLYLCRQSP